LDYELKNIIPNPLSKTDISSSEIWGKEILLENSKNYIIKSKSGKGKSTLIAYCYGLRNDFNGQLVFNSGNTINLNHDKWVNYRKENLSIVPQQLELIPFLTVWENLMLKNELTQHRTKKQILDFLEILDISNFKDKLCQQLSLGQKQRTAIVRALLQPFDWIFLDEPFSHLDKENKEKASQLIQQITKEENAGLIVTSLGEDHSFKNLELLQL
jgi:putative ABC transport system ATP-binding protein